MKIEVQPLVSIVTPVYNEEEYLAECIESILSQSYDNWDYTIVDNCSTDGSLEIARRYAAKDSRIRVYQNSKFLEMLANHNVAVRQISSGSKYCKVVLADDWIFPECLEQMVALAERYPSVGIVSAYELAGEDIRMKGLPTEVTLVNGREACSHFLLDKVLLFGSQNSVMYRANLVRRRDPFYVETNRYADFEACFALLSMSDLGFVHQVLTFSRPRPRSVGAISADVGANFGSLLDILFAYGRTFLTDSDFDECRTRYVSQYYDFLGRRLLVERDCCFWSYHRNIFVRTGIDFSRTRLLIAAIRQLGRSILDPRSTLSSIRRLYDLRKIRDWKLRKVVLADAATQSFPQDRIQNEAQPADPRWESTGPVALEPIQPDALGNCHQ